MTSRTRTRAGRIGPARRRQSSSIRIVVWAGLAAMIGAVGVILFLVRGGSNGTPASARGSGSGTPATQAAGVARAGGVEVQGSTIAMGDVPLNVTVTPTWRLRNMGTAPVALGEPQAEVIKGCCPGPLQLGASTLAPGEETSLTFPLRMHPGMDGPHDFAVRVPVGDEVLTLEVTGNFSSDAPGSAS